MSDNPNKRQAERQFADQRLVLSNRFNLIVRQIIDLLMQYAPDNADLLAVDKVMYHVANQDPAKLIETVIRNGYFERAKEAIATRDDNFFLEYDFAKEAAGLQKPEALQQRWLQFINFLCVVWRGRLNAASKNDMWKKFQELYRAQSEYYQLIVEHA